MKDREEYISILEVENAELKAKIKTYEDPADLTLMFMYCDEKAKDKIKELKKQLNYLRSGEYFNQLRFERDMLQDLVDNGEVSKEDKNFINMTHRNTELLEENEELKKQLENLKIQLKVDKEQYNNLQKEYEKSLEDYCRLDAINRNQQKEFIDYLEKNINHYKNIIRVDKENNTEQDCGRFETRWATYEEILSKYKEIIGDVEDENK